MIVYAVGWIMFDSLENNRDSHIRFRRLAVVMGLASLILFIVIVVWVSAKASEYAEYSFSYTPGYVESGLFWASLLGGALALGLFLFSIHQQWQSRK